MIETEHHNLSRNKENMEQKKHSREKTVGRMQHTSQNTKDKAPTNAVAMS